MADQPFLSDIETLRSRASIHRKTRSGPVPAPPRPEEIRNCIIEGTNWQLVTPDVYLQRYSDIVRAGLKVKLIEALNLILPKINDLELLTEKTQTVQLSANVSDKFETRQLPLHSLGGGVIRLLRLYLSLSLPEMALWSLMKLKTACTFRCSLNSGTLCANAVVSGMCRS